MTSLLCDRVHCNYLALLPPNLTVAPLETLDRYSWSATGGGAYAPSPLAGSIGSGAHRSRWCWVFVKDARLTGAYSCSLFALGLHSPHRPYSYLLALGLHSTHRPYSSLLALGRHSPQRPFSSLLALGLHSPQRPFTQVATKPTLLETSMSLHDKN